VNVAQDSRLKALRSHAFNAAVLCLLSGPSVLEEVRKKAVHRFNALLTSATVVPQPRLARQTKTPDTSKTDASYAF
jgi:hypothetical protein